MSGLLFALALSLTALISPLVGTISEPMSPLGSAAPIWGLTLTIIWSQRSGAALLSRFGCMRIVTAGH